LETYNFRRFSFLFYQKEPDFKIVFRKNHASLEILCCFYNINHGIIHLKPNTIQGGLTMLSLSKKIFTVILYLFLDPETAKIIPYGQFGIGYNSFTTKNGAADVDLDSGNNITAINGHGDSTFRGYGYDLGVGLLCRLSEKLGLDASYVYSRISLDRVEALGYTGKPENGTESDTREIRIGLSYYFN
jgi:hypothetical protein